MTERALTGGIFYPEFRLLFICPLKKISPTMNYSSNLYMRSLAVAGFAAFSASSAWAVFPFSWVTDGAGLVTDGSWMGNGSVQNNIDPASKTAQIAVQDFSSGSISINGLDGTIYAPNLAGKTGGLRLLQNPISATHTISLGGTGATADLRLHNSTNNDGGNLLFNSVGLTDFRNVTSITWTIRFTSPIAGRIDDLTSLISRPMGAGLALPTPGAGQDAASFTVAMNYTDIYYESSPNVFVAGVPGAAVALKSSNFNASLPGATSFTSDSFVNTNFLLIRGFDVGGTAGYDITDAPKVYMKEMSWTITPDAGKAFLADTIFVTSMDGEQYGNYTFVIPEPTSVLLVAGSALGACLLRRRRA